ncbi:D-serine dehydratase [Bacillus cereus]|nr:D-serine dehydratase [Bacillus cereus]
MKEIGALQAEYPLVNKLIATKEVFWINPHIESMKGQ